MEVLNPFEGLEEGDWLSPRISFSQDFQLLDRFSPEKEFKGSSEEEFSFDFHNSVSIDLPPDDSMLSAEELFFNGKLRPLQKTSKNHRKPTAFMPSDGKNGGGNDGFETERSLAMAAARSFEDNPCSFSLTIENSHSDGCHSRACMSLNNSCCSSPSRTKSMPHTTPTSPKASSSSLLPLASKPPSSSSSPLPSSSTSSSSSSFKYSSKFKDFFKLKKPTMGKDPPTSSWASSSGSAEIARECPHSSVSSSCRLPTARSFWPFSRSNSAGESKTAPAVSPPPRRSNSAGEGKTTSSSLLPTNSPPTIVSAKQPNLQAMKGLPSLANPNVRLPSPTNSNVGLPSLSNPNAAVKNLPPPANPNMSKKGLPPLPNPPIKKNNSFLVSAHCGTDAVALSAQSSPPSSSMLTCGDKAADLAVGSKSVSSQSDSMSMSNLSMSIDDPSHVSADVPPVTLKENIMLPDARNPCEDHQPIPVVTPMAHKGRGTASPGRPVMRRSPNSNSARNFARRSPGRRGVWNSPGRGNGGRVPMRNLDRGNVPSKSHVRPKDMLSRDGASVRISPVLNVPVPSLRGGTKASSKSKIFSLGNLFSKKEKAARAYTVLPPTDSQSGG